MSLVTRWITWKILGSFIRFDSCETICQSGFWGIKNGFLLLIWSPSHALIRCRDQAKSLCGCVASNQEWTCAGWATNALEEQQWWVETIHLLGFVHDKVRILLSLDDLFSSSIISIYALRHELLGIPWSGLECGRARGNFICFFAQEIWIILVWPSWVETIPLQGFALVKLVPIFPLCFPSKMSFALGFGKRGNKVFHREKVIRSGSSNSAHTQVSTTMPPSDREFKMNIIITSSDCMIMRVVARSIFLAMALAAVPFFYAASDNTVCDSVDCGFINVNHETSIGNTVMVNLNEHYNVKANNMENNIKQWPTTHDKVQMFSNIFQGLMAEGLLRTGQKALCIGVSKEEKEINAGIQDSLGFDMILEEDIEKHAFPEYSFDFEFTTMVDIDSFPVAEIERTLKLGGVAAIHLSLKKQSDLMVASPSNTIVQLLPNFKIVYVRRFDALGLDTIIAFRKMHHAVDYIPMLVKKTNQCPITDQKRAAMKRLEQILLEQPRASWIESKQNLNNIQYVPNILGYPSNSTGYVYIDIGANSYKSSIGAWFQSHYPKQKHKFDIFAIEADGSFGKHYADHPEVQFVPYAAWIKNESLTFGSYDGQNQQTVGPSVKPKFSRVRGFDLATWLMKTVTADDYVVMKMDVGGSEFQILPRMLKTGAICLVDELFLECHYESTYKKHRRAYWECLALYGMLREEGVLVHQWWG
eukprot:Gb_17852 [translate_table: standard]